MVYKRIKYCFLLVLLVELILIHRGKSIYPSLRFPAFENQHSESNEYRKVSIWNATTDQEVDVSSIIQPYDKYYYLSSLKFIALYPEKPYSINFLNVLSEKDSLFFKTEIIQDKKF